MIEYVKEKGVPIQNESFLVMDCTECIWYDALNSQWIVKHTKEEQINKSISYNVIGVAANCVSCNDPSINNVKCANMVKGHTYDFEIGEDYVKCTNCPFSYNVCNYPVSLSPGVEVVNDPSDEESIALISYKNTLYLFYHKEGTGDIYYNTSIDGKNWNPGGIVTDGARPYRNPSLGVFKDDLYVAYSGNAGDWQIFIKKFDGVNWVNAKQLTNKGFNSNSYLTTYKGKLYLFYQHSDGSDNGIRYRTCDSNCDVLANWGSEQKATDSLWHIWPSSIEYDGKLHLIYSDIGNVINDVYYQTCDDTNSNNLCDSNEWVSGGKITDGSAYYGKSHLIVYNNRLYVFYRKATSNAIYEDSKIVYRAYDGGWQKECGAAGGKIPNYADFSTATIHSGNLKLCYLEYDYDWKIICK
jgi:hypothetical protein